MAQHADRRRVSFGVATPFPVSGAGGRLARLIVLDMVLWPGALFVGASLLALWHVRDHVLGFTAFLIATIFSVAVGVRQWDIMLRSIFPPAQATPESHDLPPQEASPRLTGRGTTAC